MTVLGTNRVIRGGSWNNEARNCRSTYRNNDEPGNRNHNLGFRVLSTALCQRVGFTDPACALQAMSRLLSCADFGRTKTSLLRRLVGRYGAKTAAGVWLWFAQEGQ